MDAGARTDFGATDFGNRCEPGDRGARGAVPQGTLLSVECGLVAPAAVAGTEDGYTRAGEPFSRQAIELAAASTAGAFGAHDKAAGGSRMAGKFARIGKHGEENRTSWRRRIRAGGPGACRSIAGFSRARPGAGRNVP